MTAGAHARRELAALSAIGLAALSAILPAAGCDDEPREMRADSDSDAPDDSRSVPPGHPCPELAFAPEVSQRWRGDAVAPLALRLPTPLGLPVRVTQGNAGSFSHFGDERYAWDFGLELGMPVHAAAAGVVVWVEQTMTDYGPGPEFQQLANFVVIDHGGGLFTSYVHLEAGSAWIAPGDVVAAGEQLARTGLSGQMTGPHLHFHVENVWSESLPARFATPSGCAHLPAQDEWVTAWRVPLVEAATLSAMPADAFSEDGVGELVGLPARLFERSARPTVRGRATLQGASEVWFLVLPAVGGTALFAQRFAVHDAAFDGSLDLSDLNPGQYGVALVAGTGGTVSVPRSVRAVVLD